MAASVDIALFLFITRLYMGSKLDLSFGEGWLSGAFVVRP